LEKKGLKLENGRRIFAQVSLRGFAAVGLVLVVGWSKVLSQTHDFPNADCERQSLSANRMSWESTTLSILLHDKSHKHAQVLPKEPSTSLFQEPNMSKKLGDEGVGYVSSSEAHNSIHTACTQPNALTRTRPPQPFAVSSTLSKQPSHRHLDKA